MEKDYIIKTKNLTKRIGKVNIVEGVNLNVRKGSIYGFIGENGAGKTTILRLISGLSNSTNGSVYLFGEEQKKSLNLHSEKIGALIENPIFYPNLTGYDNLKYFCIQKGIPLDRIEEKLKLMNLEVKSRKKVKNYSLGMKQRLGISLALLNNPELLILDEPLNGLDPKGIAEIRKLLIKINEENKTTIIVSSHILSELEHIATDYGIMHHGKLISEFGADKLTNKELEEYFIEVTS